MKFNFKNITMKKLHLILINSFLFVLFSCSTDDDVETTDPVLNCQVVEVFGDINEPTTWREGNTYVIENYHLKVRSTLTIEPGVVVKLRDARIDVVDGKIIALGTPDKRIVFTSYADDRFCGDTNGDGNLTQAEKGDWLSIDIQGGTGHSFAYCDIFYAGKWSGGFTNAVKMSTSSFSFDNCRFAHTNSELGAAYNINAAFYGSAEHMRDPAVSKFTNNTFFDNGKPIYFNAYYSLDPSNKFHNPENPQQKNHQNGMYIGHSSGGQGVTALWHHTEVPYVLDEWLNVHPSSTIKIGPGAVVKFERTTAGLVRPGPSNIVLDSSAFLTSYKDDSRGGDTNGDGNATQPQQGDWKGFRDTSLGTYLQGPNILFAAN